MNLTYYLQALHAAIWERKNAISPLIRHVDYYCPLARKSVLRHKFRHEKAENWSEGVIECAPSRQLWINSNVIDQAWRQIRRAKFSWTGWAHHMRAEWVRRPHTSVALSLQWLWMMIEGSFYWSTSTDRWAAAHVKLPPNALLRHNPFYDFDDLAKAALKAPSPYDLITGRHTRWAPSSGEYTHAARLISPLSRSPSCSDTLSSLAAIFALTCTKYTHHVCVAFTERFEFQILLS